MINIALLSRILPRTCLSVQLLHAFPSLADVRSACDRRMLATFNGKEWGTGSINRLRIKCPRKGWRSGETEKRLHPDGPKLRSIFGSTGDYECLSILNVTLFCLHHVETYGTGAFFYWIRSLILPSIVCVTHEIASD